MPVYTYKCSDCDKTFSISHSFSDESEQKCENCQKPLTKVFSAPLVTFRGGGWGHQA